MTRPAHALAAALVVALVASVARADAPAPASAPPKPNCFLSNNWKNWTASTDGDTLYFRVDPGHVYAVGLTPGSHAHKYPGSFLVNEVRGSSWICTAIDLDLTLADDIGMRQPLIARSLRQLTPAEVAALPKKVRP
jgi:hypothetical protein